MQDNNTPQDSQDQGLSEAEGLEAVKRATEAALEASGVGEVKNEDPAVAEIVEGANAGIKSEVRTEEGAPKIVSLGDATKALGDEKVVEANEDSGVTSKVAEGGEKIVDAQVNNDTKDQVLVEVLKKIKDAENVLVALSADPSVDEMAAAIGLSLALDMVGKHATAIYSGKTPNVLEFLKPEETFEANADVLQDFVIALNKDKADHLRYKIEGDYVKVYVTPYKSLISEGDLEFSRGDYNVDLVIALNVPAATELDAALREYGRIMHDATSVNITNEVAGKFGDVEWVSPEASSVSEMVARLVMELDDKMDAGVATALLTGIVAATDKFANQATSPEVMMLAAKLMEFGANQQAVFKNISQKLEFRERSDNLATGEVSEAEVRDVDTSKLTVGHNGFADSAEGGEMEKYVDLSEEQTPSVVGSGIIGIGDSREKVGDEGASVGTDEMARIADEVKAQQAGYEEAVGETGAQGRGGILGSVQSVLQSVLNKNSAEGYEGSANGDSVGGASFVVGAPEGEGGEAGADAVVNQILSGLGNNDGGVSRNNNVAPLNSDGTPDYGKMIDEALNEKMPGEEGGGASGMGADSGVSGGGTGAEVAPVVNAQAAVTPSLTAPDVTAQVQATPEGAGAAVTNATSGVDLPMPGGELGVPPTPPVPEFSGLPQMPPVVEETPVVEGGAVPAVDTQMVGAPAVGAEMGATQSPATEVEAANQAPAAADPGQFQIPGQ